MSKTGTLYVIVLGGRNIIAKDWGGSSDPYCKVYLDKQKQFKTPFILKCLEPKWEDIAHTLQISAEKPPINLKFSLWDYDRFKWDEFLGEIIIPIEDLIDGVPRDDWIPLQKRKGKSEKVTGDLHVQMLFLEPGDSVTPERSEFPYPLQTLLRKKKYDSFRSGVEKGRLDLELHDKEGYRPLHVACHLDRPECVQLLIDRGADVRGTDNRTEAQPIHIAAGHSTNSLAPLLAKGADIAAKDRKEKRPLHYAAINNNASAINFLVDKGADVNVQDALGQAPLHSALLEKESWNAIRALVEKGADVYFEDKSGTSPAKLCTQDHLVTERTKREFMAAVGIKDDREFPIRRTFPKKWYVEGRDLSFKWEENMQFGIKPLGETTKIIILMHYLATDRTAKQMEKTGFIVVTSDEGIHKEPSFQQDLVGYGSLEPFEIQVVRKNPEKDLFYVVMPYAKAADIRGFYDMIFYADGEIEVKELVQWNNIQSVKGEWTPELSGGDKSLETWLNNPQFNLVLPKDPEHPKVTMTINLAQAKSALDLIPYQVLPYQFYIGYYVLDRELFEIVAQCETWKNAQETYLHFFIDTTKDNEFVIIPSTHFAGQLTSFTLTVFSDVPVEITKRT